MNLSFPFKSFYQSTSIHHEETSAETKIADGFLQYLPSTVTTPIVLVCIGTDRSTGDSFGPLVGSNLCKYKLKHFHVYGTLDYPVHALNLEETMTTILTYHKDAFIIGIDACLGKMTNIGAISIGKGPVKPGAAVNKKLPPVGNIHLTGTVNIAGYMEHVILQNTRLSLVMKMANSVSKAVKIVDNQLTFHVKH
ncbi:MAG: spore protease YyaC [Bacillaceae bacterium]